MPRGPNGEWRPAEPIARAVHIARIATGQIEETFQKPSSGDPTAHQAAASKVGKTRSVRQAPGQHSALAKTAAEAR